MLTEMIQIKILPVEESSCNRIIKMLTLKMVDKKPMNDL
jgi:hypothetical protein